MEIPWLGRSIGLALGTASALGMARFGYGLLVPAMRADLHWTLAQAGAMSTANGLGYLLGALLTAAVVRRWGTTTAFRAGMALTAVDWTPTLGAFTTIFAAGQSLGPWIAGILADHTSAGATLAWTAVLCGAAALTVAAPQESVEVA